MRDNRKAGLMSGTSKVSAESVASGNGRRGRASHPQRPLVRAWQWVCRCVLRSGRGIALDASGPAQPSGDRAKRVFALVLLLAIPGAVVAQYSRLSKIVIDVPEADHDREQVAAGTASG